MDRESQDPLATVTAKVEFGNAEWRFQTKVSVPAGPTRLRQMLPVVQVLSDAMVAAVTRDEERQGNHVSCQKGCGACCRQMVPLAQIEARYLRDFVDALPEPRRLHILARFAEARRRLAEAGLLDTMLHPEQWTEEQYKAIGMAYFQQAIACPFLEEESCSIHPQRPISCREYLVTSPAEHCARPIPETVRTIRFPFQMWKALARFDPQPADPQYVAWVPLILALEWVEQHPEEETVRPGAELLAQLFAKLSGKDRGEKPPL